MGCASGACAIGSKNRFNSLSRVRQGACCDDCAQEDARRYQASMLGAFNPFRNAAVIYEELGGLTSSGFSGLTETVRGLDSGSGAPKGGSTSDANVAAGLGLAATGIQEIGATARHQQDVDLERERIAAAREIERERRAAAEAGYGREGVMPRLSSEQPSGAPSGGAPSGGDNTGMMLLIAAGIGAALLSGAGKGLLK